MTDRRPHRGIPFKSVLIRRELAYCGMNVSELAQRTGLGTTTTSRAVNGYPVSDRTRRKIAEVLETTPRLKGIEGLLVEEAG